MVKGILFNQEMVKAILDGRKSCTRILLKLPKYIEKQDDGKYTLFADGTVYENQHLEEIVSYIKQPYQVGDILYVRETWQEVFETEYMDFYDETDIKNTREIKNIRECITNFDSICKTEVGMSTGWSWGKIEPRMKYIVYKADDLKYADKKYELIWHPSIHMPKEAARIFLKVADVRVERLQDITEEQAKKEGCIDYQDKIGNGKFEDVIEFDLTARDAFGELWNSTVDKNKIQQYGWNANPYVWVIEFERCEKPEATT